MGGAAASNFYHKTDAPRYLLGHSLVLGFTSLGLLTVATYYILCRRINTKRDSEGCSQYTAQELIEMGDKAPNSVLDYRRENRSILSW